MKKLKILIIAFALFTMNISAATIDPVKPTSQLRSEIVDLIGINCPFDYDKNECKAELLFTVNTNQELIVLSVTSPNPNAELYLMRKLNHKKVSKTPYEINQVFILPLRIIKSPYDR